MSCMVLPVSVFASSADILTDTRLKGFMGPFTLSRLTFCLAFAQSWKPIDKSRAVSWRCIGISHVLFNRSHRLKKKENEGSARSLIYYRPGSDSKARTKVFNKSVLFFLLDTRNSFIYATCRNVHKICWFVLKKHWKHVTF